MKAGWDIKDLYPELYATVLAQIYNERDACNKYCCKNHELNF